jgi:hypothetical protein
LWIIIFCHERRLFCASDITYSVRWLSINVLPPWQFAIKFW